MTSADLFDMGPPLRTATADDITEELIRRYPRGGVMLLIDAHPPGCPCCPKKNAHGGEGVSFRPIYWGNSFMTRGAAEILLETIVDGRTQVEVGDGPNGEGA